MYFRERLKYYILLDQDKRIQKKNYIPLTDAYQNDICPKVKTCILTFPWRIFFYNILIKCILYDISLRH